MANSQSVLHVIDSLGIGGAQSVLKSYLEAHANERGMRLYALRTVDSQAQIDHPDVAVNSSHSRFSLMPLLELRRIARQQSVGVLHCHLFRAQVFGFLLKLLFFPQMALVFHEHGRAVGRETESYLEVLLFRGFMRLAWRRVDRFICVSEHARTRLLDLIPGAAQRALVVANPVPVRPAGDEAHDREAIRREEGIPSGAFVVGFAARLVQTKGWQEFLDAMSRLAPELPVYFLLAGGGEDRLKAELRIRELGLENRGRLLGPIDWMRRFYACLDCFVLPSHWEAHGLAQLEAQGFGVPVVVSSVPGLDSTVHAESDALLFRPGDSAALAECIRRVALDASLRQRLAAGGLSNSARFTMDAFSESLNDVYSAVNGRPAPAAA